MEIQVSSVGYATMKKYIGRSYHDPRPLEYILHMKKSILDSLRSYSVRSYHAYDQKKLQSMADRLPRATHITALKWIGGLPLRCGGGYWA